MGDLLNTHFAQESWLPHPHLACLLANVGIFAAPSARLPILVVSYGYLAFDMPVKRDSGDGKYHLALYIDSDSPNCSHIAARLRQICQQYLIDSYSIKVFDIRQDQSLIERLCIIAVPTLEVTTPHSKIHRFVGDLSDSEMFIMAAGMANTADQMGQEAGKMGKAAAEMRSKIKHS